MYYGAGHVILANTFDIRLNKFSLFTVKSSAFPMVNRITESLIFKEWTHAIPIYLVLYDKNATNF